MKPDLYLDVDGVMLLFPRINCEYKETLNSWLFHFILNNKHQFNRIFWLSAWTCEGTLENLQKAYPMLEKIEAIPLKWLINKTEAIDWSHPFIWIDDQLSTEEKEIFEQKAHFGQQIWEVQNIWR